MTLLKTTASSLSKNTLSFLKSKEITPEDYLLFCALRLTKKNDLIVAGVLLPVAPLAYFIPLYFLLRNHALTEQGQFLYTVIGLPAILLTCIGVFFFVRNSIIIPNFDRDAEQIRGMNLKKIISFCHYEHLTTLANSDFTKIENFSKKSVYKKSFPWHRLLFLPIEDLLEAGQESSEKRLKKANCLYGLAEFSMGGMAISFLLAIAAFKNFPQMALPALLMGVAFFGLYGVFNGLTLFVYPDAGYRLYSGMEKIYGKGSAKFEALTWIIPSAILFTIMTAGAIYICLKFTTVS